MIEVESSVAEAAVERVVLVAEFPGGDRGGNLRSVSGSKPRALPISRAAMRLR
jgi:hypothetical protein